MTDKLSFHFDESPALVFDMAPAVNKLTGRIKCEIAFQILEKLTLEDLATYFTPIFNGMVEAKFKEHSEAEKAKETPVNDDPEPPEAT